MDSSTKPRHAVTSTDGPEDTDGPAGQDRALRRVARGGSASLAGAVVTGLCTFALTVVVTRGVSREAAGVFFSATSLFLVATTVGQLGTQTGLVYFIARCRALGHPNQIGGYIKTALRPMLALALVMAIGVLIFARPIAQLTLPGHVSDATTYLRLLAFFIPVAGIEMVLLAATRGLGSMRAYTLIEQIGRPIVQLVLVGLATFATSTTLLGLAWSIAYVPAAVAAWIALRTVRAHQPGRQHRAAGTESAAVDFWKFTLPRSFTSILQIIMQRFDIVLVGALAGAVHAAIYAAATRFIVVGQLGINALTLAAQPQFAQRITARDHAGASKLYQVTTAWLVLVTWPVYLVLIVFAEPVLRVFGHGYSSGQAAIILIATSMLLSTSLGMVDTILAMAGHTSWNLANAVLALGVNLALDFWLIPDHGLVGAAIGWATAIAVRNIAAALQVAIALGFQPVARAGIAALAATAACFALIPVVVRLAVGSSVAGLVLGLACGCACYAIALRMLRRPLVLHALAGLRGRRLRSA